MAQILPFPMVCNSHYGKTNFSQGVHGIFYTIPSCLMLICDLPTKMPSYMGFFGSKAISHFWHLLKIKGYIKGDILWEKQIGLALLVALVGLISVKRSKLDAAKADSQSNNEPNENIKPKSDEKI